MFHSRQRRRFSMDNGNGLHFEPSEEYQPQYFSTPVYNLEPEFERQQMMPEPPKKNNKGKIIFIISAIIFVLAGITGALIFMLSNKEKGGAGSLETICYSYVDAFNKTNASGLKDYISKDVSDKDSFVKQVDNYSTEHKKLIKELDKSKTEVTIGDSYSKTDRIDILEKYDYDKNKSDDVRDAFLSVKYTDQNDIENSGTYSCVITCMKVSNKWFILEIKDIDINPYEKTGAVVIPSGLSDDIMSREFYFAGKTLSLPFLYNEISDEYSYNLSDYGYDDDYELAAGDFVPGTIALYNDDIDQGVDIWIGFVNDSDEKKVISDCKINSIHIDTTYANSNNLPDFILPGGITWGCTYEDIEKAYGKPSGESYRADDLGYTKYSYQADDFSYYVELFVYDNKGLSIINVNTY